MPAAPSFKDLSLLEQAILKTVIYADLFNYPLGLAEIQRYLIERTAAAETVQAALETGPLPDHYLSASGGWYALAGREALFAVRRERAALARGLWPRAAAYGQQIARLPFVRMVAVSGALAMDNETGRDLDYLIVTAPGRLWVCRALVILLVRWTARRGDIICPNYFISERALNFTERNLYSAHELAQMVPLSGRAIYQEIRQLNRWTEAYLPNAGGPPARTPGVGPGENHKFWLQAAGEVLLRTPPGAWLEAWEMQRKVQRFEQSPQISSETAFCADWCKGHFGGYGQNTLERYRSRLAAL